MNRPRNRQLAPLALLLVGCGAGLRPADRIETVRALYRAEVTGFVVEAPQAVPAAAEPATPPPAETAVSPGDDGGTGLVAPPAPVSDVALDLKLTHQPGEELAGITLEVGDIIITGTPSGVGMGMDPKGFMKDGDVVECEIEGIGVLRNRVREVK